MKHLKIKIMSIALLAAATSSMFGQNELAE